MKEKYKQVTFFAMVMAAAMFWPVVSSWAYPEPAIVSKTWEFDVKVGTPKSVAVPDINGEIQWYWYMTYRVGNNTGQDRLFIPEIHIATDEGDILVAGQHVPPAAFDVIKKRERNTLLLSPVQIVGRMLQGRDFIKEGVAIWPAFGHPIDRMDIFLSGLSGETQAIKLPGNGEEVFVRKTMMVKYHLPGGKVHPERQPVKLLDTEWIMR